MNPTQVPIAIVGAGCRFPGGANSLDKLWELLSEGRSGRVEIPKDRWDADGWFNPYPEAKQSMVTKHGYFLQEDISQFDAKFFGISSAEAHSMDPQQRLFLMTTYEALEDAAIPIQTLRGSNTGVFASIFERSYDRMGHKDLSTISRTHVNGSGESILSNRISYFFDLKGPCMTIDTGCSGSLVALHQACQSLKLGESDLALVGGSQLVIHPDNLTIMSGMGMINPDGKSYAFDSRGSGYGRGEGVATIVLKRLDRAIDDGDRIHAVIVNSGIGQDGRTSGLNTPSGDAQASLSSRVYREAGLNPAYTTFVEAHGTGTQAGDREEIESISRVFCDGVSRTEDLYVGSIKPNIGHLEATSGIAGLLKSILVLKNNQIPPNLEFIKPKPSLKLYEKKIQVPTKLTNLPSPRDGKLARVSLNSFGYGGTNCHVILQASAKGTSPQGTKGTNSLLYDDSDNTNSTSPHVSDADQKALVDHKSSLTEDHCSSELIVLTASTEKALSALARDVSQWVKTHEITPQTLHSLCYTLSVRRSAFSYRKAVVASTADELLAGLQFQGPQRRIASVAPLTLVFSGQGAQWPAMGRKLIECSRHFRQSMSSMDNVLRQQGCQWSLVEEISRSSEDSRINDAELAQPATTAIQVALVDLLHSLSIRATRVIGHSSGEIAAAYAAGALSRAAAILVAYHRGVFSSNAKLRAHVPGRMMAVGLGETEALEYVKKTTRGKAVVGCVNSPSSTTISGDETAIDEIKAALDAEGVFARKLKVDTAYHSHHMQRVAQEYQHAIKDIESCGVRSNISFYSSVTGAIKSDGFGADYWKSNLISQVKFSQALTALRDDQIKHEINSNLNIFVEVGPHSALAGPSRQILIIGKAGKFEFEYLSALLRNQNAIQTILTLVGRLFEIGVQVAMDAVTTMADEARPEIIRDLKSYPWDLAPYWHESRLSKAHRFRKFPYHDLLGLLEPASTIHEPRWRYFLNLDALPWLRDHVVEGFTIYPGAGYVTMAIEAMKQLVQMRQPQMRVTKFILRDVSFSKPIVLSEQDDSSSGEVEVHLSMSTVHSHDCTRWECFRIWSCSSDGSWTEHCSGEITVEHDNGETDKVEGTRENDQRDKEAMRFLDDSRQSCITEMTKNEFYDFAKLTGNDWRGSFTTVMSANYGEKQGLLKIQNPDIGSFMPHRFFRPHVIHPITLDAVHQLSGLLFKKFVLNAACVPTKIPLVEISAELSITTGDNLICAMKIEGDGPKASKGESWVFQQDAQGHTKPVIRLLINLRAIGDPLPDEDRPFVQDKVNRLDWDLDVDFMTQGVFLDLVSSTLALDDRTAYGFGGIKLDVHEVQKEFLAADQAASIWMRDAVRYIDDNNIIVKSPHLVQYLEWMKKWIESDYCHQITSNLGPNEENRVLQQIEATDSSAELQLLSRIGKALPGIMSGTLDPLSLMLEDNLLSKAYLGGTFTGDYEAAVAYLKVLTFKNPRLRFLEVGAGTGGFTGWVLGGLARANGSGLPVEQYTYTDISSGFFEDAREKFSQWEDLIDFVTLDVEVDPEKQGFQPGSYDVILASNVLHATQRMDLTMEHVRKLLKPGGSLVLIENRPRGATIGLVFGTLAGWWAHKDDFRADTALMNREQWEEVLSKSGFGGVHVARESMMVSRAVSSQSNGTHGRNRIILLRNGTETNYDSFATEIASHSIETRERLWNEVIAEEGSLYVVVDHAEQPLLLDPRQELFESLKGLLGAKSNVLWVMIQDGASPVSAGYKGLVTAFIRVLRRESGNTDLVSFDIRQPAPHPKEIAQLVVNMARSRFGFAPQDTPSREPEFAYEKGQVLIPRIRPDGEFLKWARSGRGAGATADLIPVLYHGNRVLKVDVATPGLLNSIRFVDDYYASASIEPSHIEVKADAYSVNYKDVCVALGQLPSAVGMAGEFAGVVTVVGEDMQHMYQVGDRVMGFGARPFSNLLRINGHYAHKIPTGMPTQVAASIPYSYVTAYHCITKIAGLKNGQSILIHVASGGVGQAAIQLAQHVGATIFCVVGNAAKRQLITDIYGIREEHIFSSHARSLGQGILRLTNGEGVDVVLNSSVGEAFRDSLDCVKELGTFIELGKSEMQRASQLSMAVFNKAITFAAFDLAMLSAHNPTHIHHLLGEIVGLIETKALGPVHPITRYDIGDVRDAFRFLTSREHTGKVVLVVEPTSTVECLPAKPSPLKLRKDGTYIVAGGLGDLASRICAFLASCGAGHVVVLSRRVVDNATKQTHAAAVAVHGGQFHILQCDISSNDSMESAVSYCSELPPDRTFSHMTIEEWTTPLQPKVVGTVNLNKFFASPDLAFFITLSSIVSVVGNSGQSNYAAGNGFQDAFARAHSSHPHTQYVSLNIGAVSIDAHGALKERAASMASIRASLRQNSVMQISYEEFLANLEYIVTDLARNDDLHQSIQGVTYQSMMDVNDEHLLENPIFSHLSPVREKKAMGITRTEKMDLSTALGGVKTLEEAKQLIQDATLAKFAVFLDRHITEIPVDRSLATIGLDSLVSIELKNWMVRTFQVSLQTSELGGTDSIMALTATVASRSTLIPDKIRPGNLPGNIKGDALCTSDDVQVGNNHNFYCCRTSKDLPRYPLLDLDEAVKDLLMSIGHFAHSREEYLELSRKSSALAAQGSIGRKLYDQLRLKANDPSVESWIAEPLLKAMYLTRRYPLAPFSNFLCTHFDSTVPHSQAERASTLTRAICEYKHDRDVGKMMNYPGNEHVAVLRRGHLFKVPLVDEGEIASYEDLRSTYQKIVDLDLDEKQWTGLLTTDDRDTWGSNRKILLSIDARNATYLHTLESSVFVLCLDDDSPITRRDRIVSGYLGDGFNRWHDKCLQIVVTANGRSASIFEHSMIDIMTTSQLSQRMQKAVNTLNPEQKAVNHNCRGVNHACLEEITLLKTAEIDNRISTLRSKYIAVTSSKQYVPHVIRFFGKALFLANAAPIKATVDLTIQLASRLYFGYLPASWETVSTAHFHRGRPEIVQVVLGSVIEFCDAALDDAVPRTEVRTKLLRAAQECNAQVVKGNEGRNYFRLMDVLEVMSKEQHGQEVPELFSDPVWQRAYPRLIMQTMTETKRFEDPGYTMQDPESVWTNYTVFDDSVEVCFTNPLKSGERFQDALNRASDIMKVVIQAR
ncbi:hypothetical protein JX266_011251 [Neoarthrinium moseri]|nr:hypothetical protein JX266_011251 [Neoarthrinium moseri]